MRRRIATRAAALGLLACAFVAQSALADTKAPTVQRVDQVFALGGHHGKLTSKAGDRGLRLVIRHPKRRVRPICCLSHRHPRGKRLGAPIATRDFLRSWAGFGFQGHGPRAVLVPEKGALAANEAVGLRLGHPRIRNHGRQVSFRAHPLHRVSGNLRRFRSHVDRPASEGLGHPSLYIDNRSAPVAGRCSSGLLCEIENGCLIQPFTRCPGADLQGAMLRLAKLSFADLSRANLTRANLFGADLHESHFDGAILRNVVLVRADLGYAHLPRADLSDADLSGAVLLGTDLTDVIFCHTTMPGGSTRDDGCSP